MLRRPILLNRPLKPAKTTVFRPGAPRKAASEEIEEVTATGIGLKRTARLADKLKENACSR